MPPTVVFRGSREELGRLLRALPGVLSGRTPDPLGVARALQLRLGTALLSKVQQAFLVKSRGGVGEDGVKWAPLSPNTVAARKRTVSETRAFRAAKRKNPRLTVLAFYGSRQVDIGRDTGRLLRSITPGVNAVPVSLDQILRTAGPGEVIVGSNVPYAAFFHAGWKHQPARPLWPNTLPDPWADALLDTALRGTIRALEILVQSGVRL